MILSMFGKPRSGKSYETVAFQIIPTLKSGRKVITNMPLNIEKFNLIFGHDFIKEHLEIRTESKGLITKKIDGVKKKVIGRPFESIECYSDDWKNENGVGALLVIDECHYVLPRGKTPLEISQWYSMHGHEGFDLLLLTQNFRKVDLDIRDMCEVVYYVTKMTTFGDTNKYIRKVKDGFAGKFDEDNQSIREYDSKYFPYYKSHTKSEMAVFEEAPKDIAGHKSLFKKKGMLICFFMMTFAIAFIVYRVSTDSDQAKEVKQVAEPAQPAKTNPRYQQVVLSKHGQKVEPIESTELKPVTNEADEHEPQTPLHPFYKVKLHIVGVIKTDDSSNYVFTATANGHNEFTATSLDLIKAGYKVVSMGDCLVEIIYKDIYSDFLICDSSAVTGAFAQN